MKAQAKMPDPSFKRGDSTPAPASPPAIEVRLAANDELHRRKNHTPENPLWIINIAMAGFFIVTGLVMMLS